MEAATESLSIFWEGYWICRDSLLNMIVCGLGKQLRWSRDSMLAFGTQVHGFTPGQSCRIFRAKKSSARLSLEGK